MEDTLGERLFVMPLACVLGIPAGVLGLLVASAYVAAAVSGVVGVPLDYDPLDFAAGGLCRWSAVECIKPALLMGLPWLLLAFACSAAGLVASEYAAEKLSPKEAAQVKSLGWLVAAPGLLLIQTVSRIGAAFMGSHVASAWFPALQPIFAIEYFDLAIYSNGWTAALGVSLSGFVSFVAFFVPIMLPAILAAKLFDRVYYRR